MVKQPVLNNQMYAKILVGEITETQMTSQKKLRCADILHIKSYGSLTRHVWHNLNYTDIRITLCIVEYIAEHYLTVFFFCTMWELMLEQEQREPKITKHVFKLYLLITLQLQSHSFS